jgi:hypothetical protein
MSITDASNKVIYAGDANGGANTPGQAFDITPVLPTDSTGTDVYGYVVDAAGVVTKLTSNYSIDVGAKHFIYPTVGAVAPLLTGVNAVPIGWELVIVRAEPLSQTLALTNSGIWDGPSIDAAFDKLTMICQQIQEQVNRCFQAPINVPYNPAIPVVLPGASILAQYSGTLAYLITISNAAPTVPAFGIATDIGSGQLVWYPGYASTSGVNGSGWYAIGGGI